MKSLWKWLQVCLIILAILSSSVRELGILILAVLILASNDVVARLGQIEGKLDAILKSK